MGYKYVVGDVVKVTSIECIKLGLDQASCRDGNLFMDEMYNYCGKKLKVIKVVRNVFNERTCRMYKPRSPVYLLEGSSCSGENIFPGKICDHSCFFFWHQDWLE